MQLDTATRSGRALPGMRLSLRCEKYSADSQNFMKSTEWYKNHPGKKVEHQQRYKEKILQRFPNYKWLERLLARIRFPHVNSLHCATRRTRTLVFKPNPRQQNQIQKIYLRAAELRQWFDVVVDHAIPLAKGGLHHPNNLQIIYDHENRKKGCRLDFKPSVIFT